MKINFDAIIRDIKTKEPIMDGVRYLHHNGHPVVDDNGLPVISHPGEALTLGAISYVALTMEQSEDRQASVSDKMNLVRLASRIVEGGNTDFSVEDVALLKKRIGALPQKVVVFQALSLIDTAKE
ncbi:MAG: hypothetical protein E6R03_11470 [Hyphomicrobiaceae bacterium]|nr:MAG: hypothetical protein E6R03_11470 [Hyphomicrobiaceae bacterium]